MKNEKLTICFSNWMLVNKTDDYERQLKEMKERGFNCVRFEYGAGLLWDAAGKPRGEVTLYAPFGKFSEYTTFKDMAPVDRCDLLERVLRLTRTARDLGMQIIPSSWFFLHTNWFCEEAERKAIFELSPEAAITFFADELDRLLSALRQEDLIETVAFAEILNEFDGITFAGEYGRYPLSEEETIRMRAVLERELAKLKVHHPDVLFGYDSWCAWPTEGLIPRNIDVLNFHHYYAWKIFQDYFEHGWVSWNLEESDIPEETRYYLKENRNTVSDVLKEMRNAVLTGLDWPRRISLYSSIAEEKEQELQDMLETHMREDFEKYCRRLKKGIDHIVEVHDRLVPNSRLVMGEGAGYCASSKLKFERDSETYWDMIREQMKLLREKGLWGTIVRTTARPGEVTWDVCKDRYIEVNRLFAEPEE